jgi:hypothetical protein
MENQKSLYLLPSDSSGTNSPGLGLAVAVESQTATKATAGLSVDCSDKTAWRCGWSRLESLAVARWLELAAAIAWNVCSSVYRGS